MAKPAPLHNPLPSPARAVYGFVLYAASAVVLGLYLLWAYCPSGWLHSIGIDYYPQRYWAMALPVYFAMLFIFVLALYVGYSLVLTPGLSSLRTIQDQYSRPISAPYGVRLAVPKVSSENRDSGKLPVMSIPPIGDIPAYHVSALLCSNSKHTSDSDLGT